MAIFAENDDGSSSKDYLYLNEFERSVCMALALRLDTILSLDWTACIAITTKGRQEHKLYGLIEGSYL